jgi:hypothetical protein
MQLSNRNQGQQIGHDEFVVRCSPMKTQARSMYALVSSESAHVTMMPLVPNGNDKRIAEAIVIIVSSLE